MTTPDNPVIQGIPVPSPEHLAFMGKQLVEECARSTRGATATGDKAMFAIAKAITFHGLCVLSATQPDVVCAATPGAVELLEPR